MGIRRTSRTPAGVPLEEAGGGTIASRLNWLRAAVMGANDGIVSTAGMVVGVAGAAVSTNALLASGVAAVVAGALSMAVGEYVSVSSQRDSQKAELAHEQRQLDTDPVYEVRHLAELFAAQGVEAPLAHQVAEQLMAEGPLAAHARHELGIDPGRLTSPWQAAWASTAAFVLGALIPLVAILTSPRPIAVPVTMVSVVVALLVTGSVAAHLGRAPRARAALRTVAGGLAAMAIAYGIGSLLGTQL
ncbi:VIT family protein [uncultured Kocuria sp.]|uniref:VIT1/CCC1 transporter family protein n=1 Tax=uncultured Kocuria sp. TaxID=259305 RepID=UPI00261B2CD9|nr:VIT family protein [uncultured Kocuria sp.]